ncbi:MAG: hypothetical protein IJ555_14140 [Ruminococcus sp.]|nr:hypothetical protein [Ruminococcus sp.]MBR2284617.1 hypothetical protein [Ruminococcus sp.]
MDRSKFKKLAVISSLCVLVLIGAAAAFLTSTDIADNWFTVAKVDLDIEENFDEDEKLSAGQIITKQPWVRNTGTVNELFFVEIYVPCMEATFLDSAGQRILPDGKNAATATAADYLQTCEIFNLLAAQNKAYIVQPETVDGVTKNWEISYNQSTGAAPGWVFLEDEGETQVTKVQGMMDGTYHKYLLGYSAWVEPDAVTVPIFDQLQLRSIIDADIESGTIGQVQLNAYTIQADELSLSGLTGNGASQQYTKTDLKIIYKIIENKQIEPAVTTTTTAAETTTTDTTTAAP